MIKEKNMKALFVIDFIKGIATNGICKEYLLEHNYVIENTNKLIQFFEEKKLPIYFIRLAFDENYSNMLLAE
ncbi:hypothetical protein CDV26_07985 [Francisella halioticida]|uniref:Isochorismatase n=1 Tax=Francisella halioticida TaxID=549298 RepID=A0ABM6M083_9GAMM|nr:hypothetical protein [Francisella halioticida]ASG68335.1 hypothetical protein CDV26_07985 [Francisella halioticida]